MKKGLLIVSHKRDADWFDFMARSYKKYARGFDEAKVFVPRGDKEHFLPLAEPNGIQVNEFFEWPDKGHLHQQNIKCHGDEIFPDADYIFHADSDCVFWREMHADEFLVDGRPWAPYNPFSVFLTTPLQPHEAEWFMAGRMTGIMRGQYWWKFAADAALGIDIEWETMAWMPMCHIREVYGRTREIVEHRHKKSFDEYVRGCRNEYPQSFCEFNTLGGVAQHFFKDRYEWRCVAAEHRGNTPEGAVGYPFMPMIQSWSHGGFDRPHEYAKEVGGLQTPRQLFERLGL